MANDHLAHGDAGANLSHAAHYPGIAVPVPSSKCCKQCGETKAASEFYSKKSNRDGLADWCATCMRARRKGRDRTRENLERRRERAVAAGVEFDPSIPRRTRWTPAYLRTVADRREIEQAKADARKAWREWLYERAPGEWLDAYYAASGKPWNDHRKSDAEQYRLRYKLDHDFVLAQRHKTRQRNTAKRQGVNPDSVRLAILYRKNADRGVGVLDYTVAQLRAHIERQFTRGMTWDRFKAGDIHIDHILPLKMFDLSNLEDVMAAWALSNLRPMWAKDNLAKSGRRETLL